LLFEVFSLVLFRESASQSLALFIIIFLKDKGKELAGYVHFFYYGSLPGVLNSVGWW